ncbi:MAG: hypothetical protein COW74_05620 [Piscirickettsiaceae bacterium CG18_big_fil_WC_8_21_14_2_50_44_103]|nr:MAG: hypothetical protein COW74_05620 [Piscirickettsiaceae bacterium CG18_big_fil_WC_8_21_14_2_50_44_103]
MEGHGNIYRLGGDEFAVTCPAGNTHFVKTLIDNVIHKMRETGFENSGASSGTAFMYEVESTSDLKQLADMRMYENKQRRKTENVNPSQV